MRTVSELALSWYDGPRHARWLWLWHEEVLSDDIDVDVSEAA